MEAHWLFAQRLIILPRPSTVGCEAMRELIAVLLLLMAPPIDAQADQAPAVTLPVPTAQTSSSECCKGQACGDGCIEATKQGCVCPAPRSGS